MTTNTTTTGTSNSTTTANTTKGTSNSTNATSVAISTSDETTGTALDEQPTETPTLSVEELISLLDDDSIQNVTSSFIPPEKEQPKEWAGEVILFSCSVPWDYLPLQASNVAAKSARTQKSQQQQLQQKTW